MMNDKWLKGKDIVNDYWLMMNDKWQEALVLTIFYLPREIAVLPISWGELLIISIFSALICVYLRFMSISWSLFVFIYAIGIRG